VDRPAILALAAVGAVAFLACACREEAPPPAPPTTRVTIDMDAQRATRELANPDTPSWALEGTWAVHETRDAWTLEFGHELVIPVRVHGTIDVLSAAAITVDAGSDVDDVFVECELRLRTTKGDTRIAQSRRSAHAAAHGWAELAGRVDADPALDPRFVFVARVVKGPRTLPASSRVHVSPPLVVPSRTDRVGTDRAGTGDAAPPTSDAPRRPLNVLVISVDTLRADHLGVYGYARPTSPHVDALAARGVRFDQAISPAPWTLPAYGSLFTGLLPARHRAGVSVSREANFSDGRAVEKGDFEFLAPGVATIAERLAARGYATAAFVSNPFLDAQTGVDRGFASWTQYLNRAQAGVELAQRYIEARGDTPWFVFLHLMDPHAPYTPPPPYDERFAGVSVGAIRGYPPSLASVREGPMDDAAKKLLVDLYDGEIAYTDEWIGRLVSFLDAKHLTERTLIVLHADHGEEFWEHGGYEHGHSLHDEVLRVPLVFVCPDLVRVGVVSTRTSTVDVGPTILDLCGVERPSDLDGVSLATQLLVDTKRANAPPAPAGSTRGESGSDSRDVVSTPRDVIATPRDVISEAMLYAHRESKSLSRGPWKLVAHAAGPHELYDLEHDPRETTDLSTGPHAADAAGMREALLARARTILARAAAAGRLNLSKETLDALQKVGYSGDSLGRKAR